MSMHLPVLSRLRRSRSAWMVMFVAVLIKLVASSACLTDAVTASEGYSPNVVAAIDSCALGEDACHCDCAHAVTLPSFEAVMALESRPVVAHAPRLSVFAAAPTRSLLRPPIA